MSGLKYDLLYIIGKVLLVLTNFVLSFNIKNSRQCFTILSQCECQVLFRFPPKHQVLLSVSGLKIERALDTRHAYRTRETHCSLCFSSSPHC